MKKLSGDKINYADLIKWIFALLIIVLIVLKFTGNRVSNADLKDVKKVVEKTVKDDDTVLDGDNVMVKRLYGIDPADYDGIMLKYPSTNMNVNEVFLVKLKDVKQQDQILEAVEKRLETRKNNFENYGTNQYSILKKSVTDVQGNYIMFVVNEKTDPIVKAFEKSLK